MVVPVYQYGVHTCLVIPLTHVMVLVIPAHQLQWLDVPTLKMLLWNVVSKKFGCLELIVSSAYSTSYSKASTNKSTCGKIV